MEKVFITKKCTQCQTWHTLKADVFELSYNKNIGKLFSKHELFFLHQANFSSNTFQVLILQYPIPRCFLSLLPCLSNFTLANWTPSSARPSSCSLSVSLFYLTPSNQTPQLLDVLNHIPSQANQIYFQALFKS